jgi:chorismate mutase
MLPTLAEIAEACDKRLEYAEAVAKLRAKASQQRAILADPAAQTSVKERAREWFDIVGGG